MKKLFKLITVPLALALCLLLPVPAWAALGFNPDVGGTLNTSLTAYYNMDEASGTRDDAVGANNLTDNNTVTQATGIVTNAGQFTQANNEWLSSADTADLSYTGNFSVAGWVYLDTVAFFGIAGKADNDTAKREWMVAYRSGSPGAFEFYVFKTDNTSVGVEAVTFGDASSATWYFICCRWTASTGKAEISINGGAFDSDTDATITPSDTTAGFVIGRRISDETTVNLNGRADEWGFWKKLLVAQEVTDLYNGGSGNTYKDQPTRSRFIMVSQLENFISRWEDDYALDMAA